MLRIACHVVTLFFVGSMVTPAFSASTDATAKWGYKGEIAPAHWGELDEDFAICAKGRLQSPININKKAKKMANALKINYRPAEDLVIIDEGTTHLEMNNKQKIIFDDHGVQINFTKSKTKETITLDGETYRLVQFHFHSPSENEMNGQSYPMEIHFVHQGNQRIAVIGVLVQGGAENPALKRIIKHLPNDTHVAHLMDHERININDLLPKKRSYYRFTGSLTTPPCTEGVEWIVMKDVITASPAQIAILRKIADGTNARPVQPLFGRPVYFVGENT